MANAIAAGIAGLLGPQTWKDRVGNGAYRSPKGTRIVFYYEDVSRTVPLSGTKFTFPNVDDAYIQRTGFSSREYPLRVIFTGINHDLSATQFEAALLEPGMGRLEHPLYGGNLKVIPFGDITRRDDLKTAANQTILEVTFLTSVAQIYPSSEPSSINEILAAVVQFDEGMSKQFSDLSNLRGAINKASGLATFRSFLKKVSAALQNVSDQVASVNRAFRDIQKTVNDSLDVLIGQPLLLARQVCDLVKAPARALTGIESRLDAYSNLAASIFGSSAAKTAERLAAGTALLQRRTVVSNDLHISDLFATNAVAGSILAVTTAGAFATRPEAIRAALELQDQFDAAVAWRDKGFKAVGSIPDVSVSQLDTGQGIQALQNALALATGFLVQTSFGLVPERRIVLDRERTIIDLAAELYGQVDGKLDLLINSNNLTGSEILELPRGRVISYYPDA
jgi:prophage DNA circulation protein